MAITLGQLSAGSLVNINENGTPVQFYVATQNYESGLNGSGKTLLVRKDVYDYRQWNSSDVNTWASCSMLTWLNNTYISLLDANIKDIIGNTSYYYTISYDNQTVTTRSDKIFLLSCTELGQTKENSFNIEGTALPIASTLKTAYKNGAVVEQWTRSPSLTSVKSAHYTLTYFVGRNNVAIQPCTYYAYSRPAFTLPSTTLVDNSNNIIAIPKISSITVPSLGMVRQSLPISWSSVSISGYTINYQLQRNINNQGWTTVSSSLSTNSYTDTPQVGWNQVQYQVAAIVSGSVGDYTTSSVVPISNPSALVISGQNQDLGTITSDIPYTVSSNTGNPISLTRTVNASQVVTLTVSSGFAYSIPIADLPTGTGTIVITAKVLNGSETVTATRTWTYYKTPINIPSTGGIAQLTQNGQNIWPISLAECIKVPTFFGGTLDKALELIAPVVNPSIIASGSYTGTGQYGQDNPNTLTFSNQPLMVLIYGPNISLTISSTNTSATAYISGTTATWYSTESAEAQLNSNGVEYTYIAIAVTT